MILGLDISTSITGITILDNSGNIILNEMVDLRKHDVFFLKAKDVQKKLLSIAKEFKIEKICIEQSLNAFRPGLSSAQVILTLGKFNGIISWIAYEIFSLEPTYIGASTARKALGIKVERGQNAKEIVLKHVLDFEKSFKVEYTPKGNPKPGTYDRADSFVIAKAGFLLSQNKSITN